jgi:hypothetical protein
MKYEKKENTVNKLGKIFDYIDSMARCNVTEVAREIIERGYVHEIINILKELTDE